MRRQGLVLPRRMTSRRTACSNRAAPSLRVRARSPPSLPVITDNPAIQVTDRNGCRAASSAAGQAHTRQVPHLLHLAAGLGDQLLPPGAQVPQPRPGLIDGLGHVAAQLRGQPGDQHRVLVVGLVEGQVLGPPRPRRHQRLHAHERHLAVGGQLAQHPPPVPGRLARHRHPRPARRRGTGGGPDPAPTPDPTPCTGTFGARSPSSRDRSPRPSACRLPGRSPRSRSSPAPGPASRASRALRLRSPRDTPLPLLMNVLLLRGTPSPKRIRGTFPRHLPTRRTCFYAAHGLGLAARPGLLPDASRTLAGGPDSGPYRQVGQPLPP